jgi:predicted RND superfamily exporter protein
MGGTDISIKDVFERIGLFIEKNTGPILVVAVILILLSFAGAQRLRWHPTSKLM